MCNISFKECCNKKNAGSHVNSVISKIHCLDLLQTPYIQIRPILYQTNISGHPPYIPPMAIHTHTSHVHLSPLPHSPISPTIPNNTWHVPIRPLHSHPTPHRNQPRGCRPIRAFITMIRLNVVNPWISSIHRGRRGT